MVAPKGAVFVVVFFFYFTKLTFENVVAPKGAVFVVVFCWSIAIVVGLGAAVL